MLPLWIFETETLVAMLRDAENVARGISVDARPLANEVADNIRAELSARNYKG